MCYLAYLIATQFPSAFSGFWGILGHPAQFRKHGSRCPDQPLQQEIFLQRLEAYSYCFPQETPVSLCCETLRISLNEIFEMGIYAIAKKILQPAALLLYKTHECVSFFCMDNLGRQIMKHACTVMYSETVTTSTTFSISM